MTGKLLLAYRKNAQDGWVIKLAVVAPITEMDYIYPCRISGFQMNHARHNHTGQGYVDVCIGRGTGQFVCPLIDRASHCSLIATGERLLGQEITISWQ